MKKTIFSGFLIFCLFGVLFFVAFINIMPANAEENNLKIEDMISINGVISEKSDIDALKEYEGNVTAFVTINPDLKVIDKNGNVIEDFDKLRYEFIDKNVLFAVSFSDISVKYPFINYLNGTGIENSLNNSDKNFDISFVSDDLQTIANVRNSLRKIRAYYDASNVNISDDSVCQRIINSSNKAGANVVILSEKQASADTVTYFQSRIKSVYIKCMGKNNIDFASCVSSGALGIVTEHFTSLKSFLTKYNEFTLPLNKAPLNIAHRGLPRTDYENSLEGCIKAYQNGATHLEIDVYATTDNQIVVMHDNFLSRTTNCTDTSKKINQMTLSEIRQYKIIRSLSGEVLGSGVEIPTLDDFFEYFKDKDIVLVIEDKDDLSNTLPTLLRSKITEYNIWDKVIFIAFSPIQVEKLQNVIPEVPLGFLRSVDDGIAKIQYTDLDNDWENLAYMNCQEDPSNNSIMYGKIDDLIARGYLPFFWTYDNVNNFNDGIKKGVYGITNNCADKIKDYAKKLVFDKNGKNEITVNKLSELSLGVKGYFVNYIGEVDEGEKADLFAAGVCDDGKYYAVLKRTFTDENTGAEYTLFSEKTLVNFSVDDINAFPKADKGCSSFIYDESFLISFSLIAFTAFGILVTYKRKLS